MSFDWKEYLDLAEELAGQHGRTAGVDARLRATISRGYYAAFCSARNKLRDEKQVVIPNGPEAHRIVWSWFEKSVTRSDRKIGQDGYRLRKERNQADYDDIVVNLSSLAQDALVRCRRIIAYLAVM